MAIKTLSELQARFPDNEARAITEADMRDLVDSMMSVGGLLSANNVPLPVTTGWQVVTAWTDSADTKGLQEDLGTGLYTVQPGADGLYAIDVSLGVYSDFAGWIQIAIAKNGGLTPQRKKRSLTAGGDGEFGIPGGMMLAAGETFGLAIRGSGNAAVTLVDGQYRAIRV